MGYGGGGMAGGMGAAGVGAELYRHYSPYAAAAASGGMLLPHPANPHAMMHAAAAAAYASNSHAAAQQAPGWGHLSGGHLPDLSAAATHQMMTDAAGTLG